MEPNTSFIGNCPSSTVAKTREERGWVKENIKATVFSDLRKLIKSIIKQAVCSKCKKTILTIYTPQWRKAINKGIRCVNCKTKFTVNDIER